MTPANVAVYNWIRQAFDFRSRATRSDYWWPRLFVIIVNFVLLILLISGLSPEQSEQFVAWLESFPEINEPVNLGKVWDLPSLSKFAVASILVFGLLTLIPDLSLAWRRFHDMDKPGWLHILFLLAGGMIPFAALLEMIWFAFPGTDGPNRYGPDKRDQSPDIF